MSVIDGVSLDYVQNESVRKDSGVVPMPLIEGDSGEVILTPMVGALKYVKITGISTGDFSSSQEFIEHLDEWVKVGGKFITDLNTTQHPLPVGLNMYAKVQSKASGGSTDTLTDLGKNWNTNDYANMYVEIKSGTGKGQVRDIQSNTNDTLTVTSNWDIIPDNSSVYSVMTKINGRVISAEWSTEADKPNVVNYSIQVVEGAT